MHYVLMNQAGRYLQADNTAGKLATAIEFARYVDAFNAAPRGFRVIERAAPPAPPSLVSYEVMPDGSAPIRLSFAIKCF